MTTAGAVAVGVIMASFLVWLWYYSPPETEDEVSVWLEKQGLSHLRHFSPFRGPHIHYNIQFELFLVCMYILNQKRIARVCLRNECLFTNAQGNVKILR